MVHTQVDTQVHTQVDTLITNPILNYSLSHSGSYQIAGMANRTTLVDNNTWNNSHIALVGKAMSSNETAAYEIMRELDVDYVLGNFRFCLRKKRVTDGRTRD